MQYCNLASSSEGNVSYIAEGKTKILLDCGKNLRYIENALLQIGTSASEIDAIFISHEHADHVSSLVKFASSYQPHLYLTLPSYLALASQLSFLSDDRLTILEEEKDIIHKDLKLRAFEVSHDAARTIGFTIEGSSKMAFFTDLGYFNRSYLPEFKNIRLLVMESNYDDDMLLSGPYPPFLKRRIRSNKGHLSNKDSAEAIAEIFELYHPSYIYLAHLSKHNNLPWLALKETETRLEALGAKNEEDYRLGAHSDNTISALLSL